MRTPNHNSCIGGAGCRYGNAEQCPARISGLVSNSERNATQQKPQQRRNFSLSELKERDDHADEAGHGQKVEERGQSFARCSKGEGPVVVHRQGDWRAVTMLFSAQRVARVVRCNARPAA